MVYGVLVPVHVLLLEPHSLAPLGLKHVNRQEHGVLVVALINPTQVILVTRLPGHVPHLPVAGQLLHLFVLPVVRPANQILIRIVKIHVQAQKKL